MIILVHTHVFTADKWKLARVWSFGIFNSYRRKTGQVHPRGEILSPGDYHLVLGIFVYNEAGKILISKRAPEKSTDPDRWESTLGSVSVGEGSLEGDCRELYEKTGLRSSIYLHRKNGCAAGANQTTAG